MGFWDVGLTAPYMRLMGMQEDAVEDEEEVAGLLAKMRQVLHLSRKPPKKASYALILQSRSERAIGSSTFGSGVKYVDWL